MSAGEVNIHERIPRQAVPDLVPTPGDANPASEGALNATSAVLTQTPTHGGAQAFFHALGLTTEDLKKPQIGISSVWYESNPCNSHLDGLAREVKKGCTDAGLLGFMCATVGVRWVPCAVSILDGNESLYYHCSATT
jgi:dihydroxy-acid dehydratase